MRLGMDEDQCEWIWMSINANRSETDCDRMAYMRYRDSLRMNGTRDMMWMH
jgi:hypothetical protein